MASDSPFLSLINYMVASQASRLATLVISLVLFACASPSKHVPVEDRSLEKGLAPAASAERRHKVAPGETLWQISRRYGVSVQQLQHENAISDPDLLEPGDNLRIPPASKHSKPASAAVAGRFIWPLEKFQVSSGFGSRKGKHKGIDLRAPKGTAVRASASGTVVFSGRNGDYGRVIVLEHGDGYRTLYAHNKNNKVGKGKVVKQGQLIAKVGASGNASGPHLHFELLRHGRPVNPATYID